jgi:hypothetical protein
VREAAVDPPPQHNKQHHSEIDLQVQQQQVLLVGLMLHQCTIPTV